MQLFEFVRVKAEANNPKSAEPNPLTRCLSIMSCILKITINLKGVKYLSFII